MDTSETPPPDGERWFLFERPAEPVEVELFWEHEDGTGGTELVRVEHPDDASDAAAELVDARGATLWGWRVVGPRPDGWPAGGSRGRAEDGA